MRVKAEPLPSLGILWIKALFSFGGAWPKGRRPAKYCWKIAAIQVKSFRQGCFTPLSKAN